MNASTHLFIVGSNQVLKNDTILFTHTEERKNLVDGESTPGSFEILVCTDGKLDLLQIDHRLGTVDCLFHKLGYLDKCTGLNSLRISNSLLLVTQAWRVPSRLSQKISVDFVSVNSLDKNDPVSLKIDCEHAGGLTFALGPLRDPMPVPDTFFFLDPETWE